MGGVLVASNISRIIARKVDDTYKSKLNKILSKKKSQETQGTLWPTLRKLFLSLFPIKNFLSEPKNDIMILRNIYKTVWKNYCELRFLTHKHPDYTKEIMDKASVYLHECMRIKKKSAELYSLISKFEPNRGYQHTAAMEYIKASQHFFELFKLGKIKSKLNDEMLSRVVCSTESPFDELTIMLREAKISFDHYAAEHDSKNDFEKASFYYFFLGETIIKEIYYANAINERILYHDSDIAELYFDAGKSFLKSESELADKYITIYVLPPAFPPGVHSNLLDLFGNRGYSRKQLAIRCFEEAKELFRKCGNKTKYLECRDKLFDLNSEINDFEFNILRALKKISKSFTKQNNLILRQAVKRRNILEEDVRDYFLSHISLLIEEIAIAEAVKPLGRADLSVFGKTPSGNLCETICEFKIWGRGKYKLVIEQLNRYTSDFEKFGVCIIINLRKNSIDQKYLNIITSDRAYVKDSLEDLTDAQFFFRKSKRKVRGSLDKTINIYHIILNVPLYPKRAK